jgi:uncharacterized membrane-anchored protein YitT (DUF2179 family)
MGLKGRFLGFKAKVNNWLYDHVAVKTALNWTWILVMSTLSAFVFAIGFNVFMHPGGDSVALVSGGVSGMSQTIVLLCEVCGWQIENPSLAISILYFVINIPVLLLAFFGIGKRFAIFTIINVIEASLFLNFMTPSSVPILAQISEYIESTAGGGFLDRALFAGVCTGLSTALCFLVDISAGGVDIIAYYIALKKRTMVGKYGAFINGCTIIVFTLLTCADDGWTLDGTTKALTTACYSVLYLFVVALVVDAIHTRNKKEKIEIVTSNKDLGSVLIAAIPHGATIVQGEGVYTGATRYVITMVVSLYETKNVVKIVQKEDPSAFVQVIPLSQVYGRFFTRPIK